MLTIILLLPFITLQFSNNYFHLLFPDIEELSAYDKQRLKNIEERKRYVEEKQISKKVKAVENLLVESPKKKRKTNMSDLSKKDKVFSRFQC